MISRSRSPPVSAVASERADSGEEPGEEPWTRGALGRKDGYDRKSLPRRNWLYKIGSAPGSYTCLLRMQTSSPNACKPHESALLESRRGPNERRTVSTDTRPCSRFPSRYLPFRLSSPMREYIARRFKETEGPRGIGRLPYFSNDPNTYFNIFGIKGSPSTF